MPNIQNTTALSGLLEKVDRLKAELDSLRPLSPEQEGRVMQKFRLDWNYHSNAIEGNSLTYGETIAFLMEGLTAKGKPFKDHLDIRGHNEAIDVLIDLVKNHQHLSEKIIRELHEMILVEPYTTPAKTSGGQRVEKKVTLGAYKSMPNHVQTPTGAIHYYATPEETPAKMSDLMAWLRDQQENEDLHPLAVAAIFHYRFVAIHPFDDGNGRMSRLLMNLLLMQHGYPPVVIKRQNRQAYYYALRQADAGEMEAFVEFIGENLVRSLEIYLRGARGESIEDNDDLKKQIELLKRIAESQKSNAEQEQTNYKEAIAAWLETNFPIIQSEFQKQFTLFDSFFALTICSAYVKYRGSQTFVDLTPKEGSWLDIATSIVDGTFAPTVVFRYYFKGFKYTLSRDKTPFESPTLFLEFEDEMAILESKRWNIHLIRKIAPSDLQPVRDFAQMFYEQIEKAINK